MAERDEHEYLGYRGIDIYNSGSGGQDYGPRTLEGEYDFHTGIDFGVSGRAGVPIGVPEIFDGWTLHITENNYVDGLGNQIILVSPDGKKMAKYGHVADGSFSHLKDGQIVHTGDWIGDVGGTGNWKGKDRWRKHIHFEYGYNPKRVAYRSFYDTKEHKEIPCNPGYVWVFGDEKDKDRIDPTNILTEDMVERSTQMALENKKAHLTGTAPRREMSRNASSGGSFSAWFRTTWLGRMIYGDSGKPASPHIMQRNYIENDQPTNSTTGSNSKEAQKQAQHKKMRAAGFTEDAIAKLDKYMTDQIEGKGLLGTLGTAGVAVNFNELYKGDAKMQQVARQYFASGENYLV